MRRGGTAKTAWTRGGLVERVFRDFVVAKAGMSGRIGGRCANY